ncbi:hypothetical protein WN51_00374, partial [Melipona quadrifasciata]
VAGLERKDKDFWNYVKKYDFIEMTETWIDHRGWEIIENLRRRDIKRQKQAQQETAKTNNRCRNMERWNRYWEEEERREYDICEEAPGTMKHLTRECRKVDRKIGIEKVLSGRKDERESRKRLLLRYDETLSTNFSAYEADKDLHIFSIQRLKLFVVKKPLVHS